ncbi:MAG: TonB-dependent receptor [Desulfobacterales bacterium]|nr:TonB-dependent receptor [Desulfobacterales bacterium]
MKRFVLFISFLLVFSSANRAFAQNSEKEVHEMEEVVVTATHKMKVINTPASISIITAKELEEMGAKNIAEALRKLPGVIDKSAKNDAITIRGMESSMAGGPVILIDGVPQKIGDYRYDQFGFIPVSQVERIEVLRSAGIVHGPGSARGVINIITKKGKKDRPINFDISGSYGSWNTHNEYAGLSGKVNQWDYFVNVANYSTDGYEEEKQNRTSGLLKFGYHLSDQTRLGISSNILKNEHDTAYGFWKYDYQLQNYRRNIHFPESETDPKLIWHSEKNQDVSNYALEFSHKDSDFFIASILSYTNYKETHTDNHDLFTSISSSRGEIDDKDQDTHTLTISGGYNFEFGNVYYTPTIGLNVEDIEFSQRRTYPLDSTKSTAKYDFDIDEQQYGLFWDNDFLFGEKWGLKIGGRVDKAELKFEDRVPNKVDVDETMFGWSVAPSYHFSENGNIYVSAGKNYWFPTPRYYAWAAEKGGNENRPEDLKPEESLTYELGYKHMVHKAFNVALTGFFTEYKDKFASYRDIAGTWKGMKNIDKAEIKGLELETDGRLCSWFGYRFVGTYLKAEWTKGQMRVKEHPTNTDIMANLDGYYIIHIPQYTCVTGLDFYPIEGLKCSMDINYYGSYYVDYLNRIKYPSKTTVDANISYSLKNWKFWLLGKNIFDEEIENVQNSTGKLTEANGEPKNAYYVQDGAYFEAGVSYHF